MTSPTLPRQEAPARRRRHNRGHRLFAWCLLAPAAALFLFVYVIPIGYSGVLSMSGTAAGTGAYGVREQTFVGFRNYRNVLADNSFWSSLATLGRYVILAVPLMMSLAILLALLLDLPRVRARSFSRISIFLPYGVPSVIAALMWGFLYVPGISPFYRTASAAGISIPELLRGDWVLVALTNVVLWGGIGFNTIIIYTALRSLPKEQIDAARIDGCGEVAIAWHIKLPHVVPATILTGLFSIIGALQIYSEPQMLSTLTPAIHSAFMPLMRVYRDAFAHDDLNSAAAASILLALLTVALSLLVVGLRALVSRRRA